MNICRIYVITIFFIVVVGTASIVPLLAQSSWVYTIGSTGSVRTGIRWLHAVGDKIVDSYGWIVDLKGVDLISTETRTNADYDLLQSWGVTVVRYPVRWDWLEPKPGSYSQQYLQTIDNEIQLAKTHGIYVILDMHQWHWSTVFTVYTSGPYYGQPGYGFPAWLCSSHPNTPEGYNQSISDFWSGLGPNGTSASVSNPSQQDRFIAAWRMVASRYANEPTVAAYDLFNEPPRGVLSWTQHANILYPFYDRLAAEIRKIDSKHILNYEPSNGYATYYARKIPETNTAISINFYSLRKNYTGNVTALKLAFDDLYNPIKTWGIPFLITEVGIELTQQNFTLWANDALNIFTGYGLSWMWYTYGRSDEPSFCMLYSDGTPKTVITDIIRSYLLK